jgi:serine/threonine protein kinase
MLESIEKFLLLNDYKSIELIQENKWKKTMLFKIEKDGVNYILKSIDKASPVEIKNKFLIEVEYYKHQQYEYLPKYIESNQELLILEFIEGRTLREELKHNLLDTKTLALLIKNIEDMYVDNKRKNKGANNFKIGFSHVSNLLQSGPIQKKDIKLSFYKKILNKLILMVLKIKLRWYISRIDKEGLKNGFVHGDLHYNNIIIDNGGGVKFIDFENIRYDGFFDFDIMYLYAMLEVNIDAESEEMKVLQNAINQLLKNKFLIKTYSLFRDAVNLNNRFIV